MAKTMTSREIYAANVRRLLGDGPEKTAQQRVADTARRAGHHIDQKTVSRAAAGTNQTLDKVEAIAAGLGVPIWQLLMPENVLNFPKLQNSGELLALVSSLNEAGMIAAMAVIKGLADRPEFQVESTKGKRQ